MEYRLYSFVNFYLSSIQQGIQTGHCVDEMTAKYLLSCEGMENPNAKKTFIEWLTRHKTYIVLNGGDNDAVVNTFDELADIAKELPIAYSCFFEPGLGNIMTCCNVVVSEKYFKAVKETDENGNLLYISETGEGANYQYHLFRRGSIGYKFIELIKSKPLAR